MKTIFKSATVAVALSLSLGTAVAHSDNMTCDADFAYNIEIQDKGLSFSSKDQEKVLITASSELFLDGQKQLLSPEQLELLEEYNQKVRDLLPLASGVAEEASSIAIEAVGSVAAALLQDSPERAEEFVARVETISAELKQHISSSHLRPEALVDYVESSDFEAEFESLIETAVTEFMENNVGEMIAAAMSGNEEKVKAFEKRMESFGKDLEDKMERRAEQLELQAEKLCDLVQNIDKTETQLVKAFNKFDSYQLITN
ncbi:DUF2884 family protein [Kangiella geojedonensis]|uniref:DUF2884 family protein n=1 Tax=Kangiella geojedonensis TaxID=914150 RepID=A0A0F6TRA2_9GAMM|nr:DUF2884 family protein [Kangiella geojedonensis]AKE52134.1 hypothetical protein TQ33_1174 [Kangiella geojedonensis]